ncbi:F-box protein SKIP27-like [Gossypium australe]|uniref:F-box protein SKIP27-like n=1 Tax=Gossypium australe TaxID=47621 RepID=A0A5B6UHG2_9ROSI|nr:F-box protein SKIP27-like [Gossypium australe]
MALGKICRSSSLKFSHGVVNDGEESGIRRFVRCNSGLGRKRIEISNDIEEFSPIDSPTKVPLLERHCSERIKKMMMIDDCDEKSVLESLPQDVLVKIICGVDHEDLKQLFKTVIAKKMHFVYSTPRKVKGFRTSIDLEERNELEDGIEEAPNAPRQWRSYRSINRKKLASISVALFASHEK